MTAELDPRLARLGDALLAAARADLRADSAADTARARGRRPRRLVVGLTAAAVAVPGVAVAATQLFGPEDVARSLPAGTLMLQGTEPACTVVRDQVEYRCTLKHAPHGDVASDDMKGTVEGTVDDRGTVNGGCRALTADGRTWECYLGRAAVRQRIIGAGLLGTHSPGPAVG
jgi:hypothetical protein